MNLLEADWQDLSFGLLLRRNAPAQIHFRDGDEALVADPEAGAHRLSSALDCDPAPLQSAFANVRDRSVGRWRRDLTPEQLAEVESEAGALLAELGYA